MLKPGDFAPNFVMPDRQGNPQSIFSQELAGQTIVAFLVNPTSDVSDHFLFWIESHNKLFLSKNVKPLVIASSQTKDFGGFKGSKKIEVLFDLDRRFTEALGFVKPLSTPAVLIVDRNGRIITLLEYCKLGEVLNDLIVYCDAELNRYPPQVISNQTPVLLVPRILEIDECDQFIVHWALGEKRQNEISSGTIENNKPRSSGEVKRRTDVLVPDDHSLNKIIQTRINTRVLPEITKAFRFDAKAFDVIRIGCYDSEVKGFFKPHRDTLSDDPANPRKFALSLNLNDEYTGGAIRFPEYGTQTFSPEKGGGIVFSCALLHEALPVETGQRFGIFLFFT